MKKIIYTHDEAAEIVDLFDFVLLDHDICVPSPEDYERADDDMLGLYGSTYSYLLDQVEGHLNALLSRCKNGEEVVAGKFSGRY